MRSDYMYARGVMRWVRVCARWVGLLELPGLRIGWPLSPVSGPLPFAFIGCAGDNGGECVEAEGGGGYACACVGGYEGESCNQVTDLCAAEGNAMCAPGGECVMGTPGTYFVRI